MKTSIYTIAALTVFLLLTGCNRTARNEDTLDKSVKETSLPLTGEEATLFKEFIHADRYMVYRDSILIVCNGDYNNVKFLEFYNLNDNSLINSYFLKGRGPGELLSGQFFLNGNILIVDDFQRCQISFMDLDSVLSYPGYIPKLNTYGISSQAVNLTKDGKLLLANPYSYYDKAKGTGNKNVERFVVMDFNEPEPVTKHNYYYTFNMADGDILTNYDKNRVIFAAGSPAEIEIYDGDLNLLRKICGPDSFELRYRVEDNMMDFLGGTPVSYYGICATNEKIFLIYYGEMLKRGVKMREWKPYLFIFNWDGDFEKSYNLDRYLYCISVSQDGETLYATGYDEDGVPKLYKYALE